jgi:hypothetical protein
VARAGKTLLCYTSRCVEYAMDQIVAQVLDTVLYNLRYSRDRRERTPQDRIPTDEAVWTWHPAMGEFWELGRY